MLNLQLAKAFLKHRLYAKTRHGVHSPFVYRFLDIVIYDFKPRKEFKAIEKLREELLQDERIVAITDLGAGSQINNKKHKPVKELAKNALKSARLAQLISRIAADIKPANMIELGTCLGITTAYLSKAVPNAQIITIEGCPQTAQIAKENLERLQANNLELLIGNFDDRLPEILQKIDTLDFLFVDGNHRKDATLRYFYQCLPKITENSIIIFDDIYWSKEMQQVWEEIKNHPEVTITMDLFWIGLVFFKKNQAKEHFKIKF